MTALAYMKENFEQIFEKFQQLELKVNSIIEKQNELSACSAGGSTSVNSGIPSEVKGHPALGTMEAQLNTEINEVNHLQAILCERESYFCSQISNHHHINKPFLGL